jgi:tetratricopeptide (TPR) repeat protein
MSSTKKVKKFVFYLVLIFIPIVLLVLLEFSLGVLFPSLDNPIVTQVDYDGIEWYQVNRAYLQKFFPYNSPSVPEFKSSLFRKEKNSNLFRIVCLGGSSMFGTPYQMTANIPGILRKQLRFLYPDREFEVINFGASAINSNVISRFSRELIKFKPDLVLIYLGHNEFYGPDGVGATKLEKKISWLTDIKYLIRELRIVKLLRSLLTAESKERVRPGERNLMRQVSEESKIKLDSDDANRVFKRFENNLEDMVTLFRKYKIPVIISDVVSNYSFPPFSYEPSINGITVSDTVAKVKIGFDHGDYEETLKMLNKIQLTDSTNALINYWLGKCKLTLGESSNAKKRFIAAKDYDLLKFRAPTQISDIIKNVCLKENVPFVSAINLFESESNNKITDYNLFWEHLHPNLKGYYLLSDLFLKKIIELNLVQSSTAKNLYQKKLPYDLDSLSICWLDLAYADVSIKYLTGKWPFKDFTTRGFYYNNASENLKKIVWDVYSRKIVWDEGCYRTAAYFEKTGDYRQAETTYRAIIEEYPYNFYAHYQLARMLKDTGRLEEALVHYQISTRSKPDYLYSWLEMGMVDINLGRFDEAITNLNKALTLSSGEKNPAIRANIYYGLSAAFANRREFDKALNLINQALAILPDYAAATELQQYIIKFQVNK